METESSGVRRARLGDISGSPAIRLLTRRFLRHSVALDAVVIADSFTLQATTVDISAAGARLALNMQFSHDLVRHTSAVRIAELGHFDCIARWATGRQLGVEFKNAIRGEELLERFLSARDT